MALINRHICTRIIRLLFVFMLLMSAFLPLQAWAEKQAVHESNIELTGKFESMQFDLSTSEGSLFHLKDIAPGDIWKGNIHVTNNCSSTMEVSIISIQNDLQEDEYLFNQLALDISIGSKEIYSGSYGKTGMPVSDWYPVAPGDKITFQAVVTLPELTGNEGQGREMDSTWLFEARLPKQENQGQTDFVTPAPFDATNPPVSKPTPETVKTGDDMTVGNTSLSFWLILSTSCGLAIVVTCCRIHHAKKNTANKDDPNS